MVFSPDIVLIAQGNVFRPAATLDCMLEIVLESQITLVADNPDALVLFGILVKNISGIVGRTVIAYNELEVAVCLSKDRFYLLTDISCTVVGGHHYGNHTYAFFHRPLSQGVLSIYGTSHEQIIKSAGKRIITSSYLP